MHNPFILGEKIYLRAPEESDINIIALTENHPESRSTLFYALPQSFTTIGDKIKSMDEDPHTVVFTICKKEETEEVIGMTAFVRVDWVSRAAIYYIAIAEETNRAQGFGKETTQLMIKYAFETLNLNRIQLHVYVNNERAIRLYKSCGFVIEGTLRQAMYRAGKYYDFYVMGLLRGEKSSLKDQSS